MAGKLFFYFGDDEAYFRALQGEFRKHAKVPIDFKRVFEKTETRIQTLFLTIFTQKPDCVFIDFSKMTPDYLHLARLISRTPLEQQVLMVGLVDYLSPPEVLKESIATGVQLNFIKSAETFDVAYSVTKLIAPESIGEHGFANCTLKEDFETGVLCKVGYVQNDGMHIETDHKLSKGDRVILSHHWLENRIVPSKHVFVKSVSDANMFYQFKYNSDLDFLFVDDFLPPEGMPEEVVKQKQGERDEAIRFHKKQYKKWLDDNVGDSQEKKAKVLVVDYKFHFYQDQARTDKHPYTIRCIPFFNDISLELNRLQPQVIAYEMDKGEGKNTLDYLRKLVGILSSMFDDLNPYIIVFNTELSSADLQAALQYTKALAHKDELSPDLLIKLADMLQKKISKNVDGVIEKKDASATQVFIKKNHSSSIAEILKPVTITKLSETDLILQSEYAFAPGTNLHFTEPVEMFVHINPVLKPSGKLPEYYGLIHSIGESDKKELRRYVNAIFFRDHDAQVTAEGDEFKKLNELKLQEKILAAQKIKDAADAEAATKVAEKKASEVPEKSKEPEVT
jgi:hypothetical protein